MNTTTRLICTECGTGNLKESALWPGYATCVHCGEGLRIATDIAPYADDATLSTDGAGYLVAVTA